MTFAVYCSNLPVMADRLTKAQRFADRILREKHGESLVEFLTRLRRDPDSPATYEQIGRELYIVTDGEVSVSYQTIKRWLIEFGVIGREAA